MAALTSTMPVGTMAAFLLVIVVVIAVQTTATRPVADGYAATPTTTKPAEDGYAGAAAATTTTDKPVEQSTGGEATTTKPVEDGYAGAATTKSTGKTGGEATAPVAATKPAKEGYAAATNKPVTKQTGIEASEATADDIIKITKTADKYAQEASTAKPAEDGYAGAAATTTTDKPTTSLGEKSTMGTGPYHVSEKEIEAESSKIRDKLQQLANSGEKDSDAYSLLVKANTHLRLAGEKLKDSTTATSPEKIAACKKDADANFFIAMFCIAGSRGPGAFAATHGTFDVKPASKQAMEAVAQPTSDAYTPKEEASTKEETGKQPAAVVYTAKDATSKGEVEKQPAADAYTAKVDAAPKEEASTKEETGKQPTAVAYTAKDVTSKDKVGKQPAADTYAAKVDVAPKEEASTKEETEKQPAAADAYARRT